MAKRTYKDALHGHHTRSYTSPTYKSWCNMLRRCRDKNGLMAKYYANRGITVCERWKKFKNFLADMRPRPEGKSIDRVNNDLGYFPENCRWATEIEQQNNRSNNRKENTHGPSTP